MGIFGVGTDILEISRIETILQGPSGPRFAERVLTPAEREIFFHRKNKAEFLAGRFAGKEAVSKALGTGIGKGIGFQEMEIVPGPSGRPICRINEAVPRRLGLNGPVTVHISISHSDTMAAAYAVVELHEPAADGEH